MKTLPVAARPYVWQKGKSGNPGGRPKSAFVIAALARSYGEEAIDKLVDIMRNSPDDGMRARAASAILERGYGKPYECLEDTIERPQPTHAERLQMLAEIAHRLGYEFKPRIEPSDESV